MTGFLGAAKNEDVGGFDVSVRNILLLQNKQNFDQSRRLLNDELKAADFLLVTNELFEWAFSELHDQPNFPDGPGEPALDLNFVRLPDLGKSIAT